MPGWVVILSRSVIFLILLFLTTKMLGKKQISELSFFEYVSGITIGSIAGEAITGLESNLFHGALAIIFFGIATLLVDILTLKSKSFRDIVEGRGTVFIKDGKILEENVKKKNIRSTNYLPYSGKRISFDSPMLNLLFLSHGGL